MAFISIDWLQNQKFHLSTALCGCLSHPGLTEHMVCRGAFRAHLAGVPDARLMYTECRFARKRPRNQPGSWITTNWFICRNVFGAHLV
jgi:hypothetical protein